MMLSYALASQPFLGKSEEFSRKVLLGLFANKELLDDLKQLFLRLLSDE